MSITTGLHAAVFATTLTATLAIAFTGVAFTGGGPQSPALKADRLSAEPVCAASAECPAARFITVETRQNGVSVLTRVVAN